MYVLDASALLAGIQIPPEMGIITYSVWEEVHHRSPDMVMYHIISPTPEYLQKVKKVADKTGDINVLSQTDIELLAVAVQEKAILITDDYAMQNVASVLGVEWKTASGEGIHEVRRWKWRCESCGRYFRKHYEQCPVCGGRLRRVKDK